MMLIKLQSCAVSAAFLFGVAILQAAEAQEKSLNELFTGNTLVVKNRHGSMFVHFDDGGRFHYRQPKGEVVEGIWRVTDDSVCLTQTTSLPQERTPPENCLLLAEQSFGAIWTKDDPRNGTITYKLMVGHSTYEPIQLK